MQMLQCSAPSSSIQPSFNREADAGLSEYRKNAVQTMQEKAKELEMKIYFPVRWNADVDHLTEFLFEIICVFNFFYKNLFEFNKVDFYILVELTFCMNFYLIY